MNNITQQAIFGAGCFWGVQFYFDQIPGVLKTTAGYTGGHTTDPNWYNMHEQDTGHTEVVLIEFNPTQITYEALVRHFFRIHDPTLLNTEGINVGSNYRSAAFYFDAEQKEMLEKIIDETQSQYEDPIVTEISPVDIFYEAEPIHQKYAERTGRGMCHIPYEPISQN